MVTFFIGTVKNIKYSHSSHPFLFRRFFLKLLMQVESIGRKWWVILRYKLLVGVLVLALIISLGFNYHYSQLQTQNGALLNTMRSRTVLVWANEMSIIGLLIENATTNFHMGRVFELTESAWRTGEIFSEVIDYSPNSSHYLYWQMVNTPKRMGDNLFPYAVGYPKDLKYINPSAFPMFKNLADTIYNMTRLISRVEIDDRSGVDPTEQLAKRGFLNDIISYCVKIQDVSKQLLDFNPKFQ